MAYDGLYLKVSLLYRCDEETKNVCFEKGNEIVLKWNDECTDFGLYTCNPWRIGMQLNLKIWKECRQGVAKILF